MAYQVPLRFISVGENLAICATRITSIMSINSLQARDLLKQERLNRTLINGCGRDKAKTAILLDNGSVVSSPYTINVLLSRIERANYKNVKPCNMVLTQAAEEVPDIEDPENNANEMDTDL